VLPGCSFERFGVRFRSSYQHSASLAIVGELPVLVVVVGGKVVTALVLGTDSVVVINTTTADNQASVIKELLLV